MLICVDERAGILVWSTALVGRLRGSSPPLSGQVWAISSFLDVDVRYDGFVCAGEGHLRRKISIVLLEI